jgi:hypothetical protein
MNREFAFFFPVLALILAASVLHAQVPVSAAAVANAFERPIVNKRVNALAIADTTASARNMASTGPRYNVAQFGAVGDGSTDDTAAIQAAYNTCWNGGIGPYGGVVEFPGTKTYVISSTINVYDQCKHEGQETNGYSNGPVQIRWNGPAVGATYSITGFTTQANNRATLPCGGAICATASAPVIPNPYAVRHTPYVATLSTTSTTGLAANQWVSITGCSTRQGVQLNNLVTQVAAVSTHSFTVVVPWALTNPGTYTDTCTATTTNVAFATDTNAHYNEEYRNLSVMNKSGLATANGLGVVFYFNSRVDTGTRIYNTQAASASLYGYYFANGGINSSFNGGWRCDGIKTACIYWRPVSNDNLGIEDGTVDNNLGSRVAQSGGVIFVDNAHCATGSGSNLRLSMRHVNFEVNSSIAPGLGAFTLLDGSPATCGGYWSYYVNPQLLLSLDSVIMNMATTITAGSAIVVSPANDAAVSMNLANVQFSGNATSGPRYVGLPALSEWTMSAILAIILSSPILCQSAAWDLLQQHLSIGLRSGLKEIRFWITSTKKECSPHRTCFRMWPLPPFRTEPLCMPVKSSLHRPIGPPGMLPRAGTQSGWCSRPERPERLMPGRQRAPRRGTHSLHAPAPQI